jgi:hypothetical protein
MLAKNEDEALLMIEALSECKNSLPCVFVDMKGDLPSAAE